MAKNIEAQANIKNDLEKDEVNTLRIADFFSSLSKEGTKECCKNLDNILIRALKEEGERL
jgi:hypothetical protein